MNKTKSKTTAFLNTNRLKMDTFPEPPTHKPCHITWIDVFLRRKNIEIIELD